MRIIRSIEEMLEFSSVQKRKNKTIGFVPTMGALHLGHLSLVRQAKKENDVVVVSIFVNPAQFLKNEDFSKYPRVLGKDKELCNQNKVDVIFYPSCSDMYPKGYKTYVAVEDLDKYLCGQSRPGHFRGVTTVVAKLFNIIRPDIAYFGQKDAQQAIIIKRMTRDLNFPLKIKVLPIVRESQGLALSSRNVYLNKKEKEDALCLWQALKLASKLVDSGVSDPKKIKLAMRTLINSKKTARIDYIEITSIDELLPVKKISKNCLIALAVYFGKTRLIDNIMLN